MHGIFELTGGVLKAEVEKFFLEGFDFFGLFVGGQIANFINLHAYHRLR